MYKEHTSSVAKIAVSGSGVFSMKFIKCVVFLTPVFARSVVKANPLTRNVFFGATTTRDDRSRRE